MKQLAFCLSILVMIGLLSAFAATPATAADTDTKADAKKPNIILIYCDDHAYQTIGAYGSVVNETPNIDRLAEGGMRFDKCLVTNSICGPCRAVIQTGKYSHKNGFYDNRCKFDGSQQTFPKLLQKAGYQTAVVGKWHLKTTPQGYDYSEVLIGQGPYYNPVMKKNGKKVKHTGYTTEIITDLTVDWLKNKRDPNKPFMLMFQHKAPHRNWAPKLKYYKRFDGVKFKEPDTLFDDYSGNRQAAMENDMTIADTLSLRDLKLVGPRDSYTDEQKAQWHKMYDSRVAEHKQWIEDVKSGEKTKD
ncbi:MAG: sulfatase-like hydrolase/transferase, partial [Planctomycetia bacterium]